MEAPGAVSTGGRAGAMAARVADTARRAGVSEVGVRSIVAALDTAMRPRSERLDDDHHPDYLHPARTVLILLEDAGVVDPATLSAAALTETLRPELAAEVLRQAACAETQSGRLQVRADETTVLTGSKGLLVASCSVFKRKRDARDAETTS